MLDADELANIVIANPVILANTDLQTDFESIDLLTASMENLQEQELYSDINDINQEEALVESMARDMKCNTHPVAARTATAAPIYASFFIGFPP